MYQVSFDKQAGVWVATEARKKYQIHFEQARISFRGSIDKGVHILAVYGADISDQVMEKMRADGGLRAIGLMPGLKRPGRWSKAQLHSDGTVEIER